MGRAKRLKLGTAIRQGQLAAAAAELLAAGGLKALTCSALARRVGVVPADIYRHFRSKGQVVAAAVGIIRARVLANAAAARAGSADPAEQLRLMVERQAALVRSSPGLPRFLFSEGLFGEDPRRRAAVRELVETLLGEVRGIVEAGQRAGRIRRDLDAAALAVMFLGLFQPSAMMWHLTGRRFDMGRQIAATWRAFSSGIIPARGARARSRARGGKGP